jgi:hypothetical protein
MSQNLSQIERKVKPIA